MIAETEFAPSPLLRGRHAQTFIASVGRAADVNRRAKNLQQDSSNTLITVHNGVRLQAAIAGPAHGVPTVAIIHGWLGHNESTYVRSVGALLLERGFRVTRLNLRDHGNTAHLNEDMFNAARTQEVVDAVHRLISSNGGVLGFSLGGNFALRVARALGVPTLAVCPVIDPAASMSAIDTGIAGYRWYFLRKWRRALIAKARAFPDRYQFEDALRVGSVSTMTRQFVERHTEYPDVDAYLAAYTLTGNALAGTRATVVAADDDPIIPIVDFNNLPASIDVVRTPYGGHCGFIDSLRGPSWIDRYAADWFENALR